MTPASILSSHTHRAARLFVAGCVCVLLSASAGAQQQTGATTAPSREGAAVQQEQPETRPRRGFVDTDGDGINDRSRRAARERARTRASSDAAAGGTTAPADGGGQDARTQDARTQDARTQDARTQDARTQDEQSARPRRRAHDTFIDTDGDGINDARSSGTGTGLGTGLRGGAGRRRGR